MTFLHKLSQRLARMKAGTATPTPATLAGREVAIRPKRPIAHPASPLVVSPKTVTPQHSKAQALEAVVGTPVTRKVMRGATGRGPVLHPMSEQTP